MDVTVETIKTITLTLSANEFFILSNALVAYQNSSEYIKNQTPDYKTLHMTMIKTLADSDLV